jgi:hypothetical protein
MYCLLLISTHSAVYNITATNEFNCSLQLSNLSAVTVNPTPKTGGIYRRPNHLSYLNKNSTRLFFCLPSGVSLVSMGIELAKPL